MVAVHSRMRPLGSPAPSFSLSDTTANNALVSLADLQAKPLLVMFICNHCPYVIHIAERMNIIANDAVEKGFSVVAISANDAVHYPEDGPEAMADFASYYGFKFPYLYDESQSVAQAYGAVCTPDFFLFDGGNSLVYRGQMDASRPGSSVGVTGNELSAAIEAVYSDNPVNSVQVPSIGCSIKWKAGTEPG